MPTNAILIVVGAVLFLAGIVKLWSSQSGGFSLSNFGINIGSTNTQGNVAPDAAKSAKPDLTAVLGLLTALVGWLKG